MLLLFINNTYCTLELSEVTLKLHDAVVAAHSRQWSMSNTFTVQISLGEALVDFLGSNFDDSINLNIIGIVTPDFTNAGIAAHVANTWKIHNTRDEVYSYTITFRDDGQMNLYRKFLKIYEFGKVNFFSDASFSVRLLKDADWANEEDKPLFDFDSSLVTGISNLDFSNEQDSAIAQFTVNFKTTRLKLL